MSFGSAAALLFFAAAPLAAATPVSVREEKVVIPTWEIGPPSVHPSYPGPQGVIYPYTLNDVLIDRKADRSYDAGAIVALAIAKAGDAAAIKAAIPEVVSPDGEKIFAGKDEFAKALGLIKEGKPIKYEGVIGPVNFDEYGDITGPFRLWKITDGAVTTVGEMSADDVVTLKEELAK